MRGYVCALVLPVFLFVFLSMSARPQELSSQPKQATKVCVAVVRNATTTPLFVERITARLTKSLVENKLAAVTMDSATTADRELRPSLENAEELKSRECDYLVLTRVTDPKTHRTDPGSPALRVPPVSIGGRTPSVDASDPMGGQSGPAYRDDLEIDFALFRPGKPSAAMNATLVEQPSANVSDSLVQAMDRVANRVKHELKKK
jgi:hypothetical protein